MNITFDKKLQDYMAKKGYAALSAQIIDPVGCCADVSELCIGFIRHKDLDAFREKALRVIPCEHGDLYQLSRGIEFDDQVELRLRSFFGAKDVVAKGMHAFRLK